MAKGKKGKSKRERRERRFLPRSSGDPMIVKVLGAVGAIALGAGTWAQFGRMLTGVELPPYAVGPYILGAGAAAFGAAIWLGTTNEPPVRVGPAGIAVEKAEMVRIPWYAIERVVWDPAGALLTVRGKDDLGKDADLTLRPKIHPLAAAWVVREARARIPKLTDVPDEVPDLPAASSNDGELLALDPVQVVGRHCAESGKVIAYEPDAVVCPSCELVYHKSSVPDACACGASLAALRPQEDEAKDAAS